MARLRFPSAWKLRHHLTYWAEKRGASGGSRAGYELRLLEWLAALPLLGPECHHLAGLMHAAAGRYEQAITHYETALARSRSPTAALYHHLGLARLHGGYPEAAESNFRHAIALAPHAYWSYHDLGKSLFAQNRLVDAEPCFRRAIALAPHAYWSYQWLGECLLAQDRPADAEPVLRKGIEIEPYSKWVHGVLFKCRLRQGREVEAIDYLIQAAATAPPGPRLLSIPFPQDLFFAPLATEARAQAMQAIVERHPEAIEATMFLAHMKLLLGRNEEATHLLRRAASLQWPGLYRQAQAATAGRDGPKPPSFLIIGQGKAGTTALFAYLCTHPHIEPPLIKEPQFWSLHYAAGEDWYRALFPPLPTGSEMITGEGSTSYFTDPNAPRRIAAALPNIKLILLLRDPVARAYSSYWMHVRLGQEQRDWETVVNAELESLAVCPREIEELDAVKPPNSYLIRSAALPHIKRWLSRFPRDRLLILQNTELSQDMPATLRRVCALLDLPSFVPPVVRRENVGHYQPMPPAIEQRLRAWFEPHQRELETFLAKLAAKSS